MSKSSQDRSACLRRGELQLWLSPAFPVGSFAYSHGLEWAAGAGRITDRSSAEIWLAGLLECGAPRNDAILLAQAWKLVAQSRDDELAALNELSLAMAGSRERYAETVQQGNAFLGTIGKAWSSERHELLAMYLRGDVAYPIAVGASAAARGIELDMVVSQFLIAFVQNLVSALVRLSVLGQTDGQRVLASLIPMLDDTASHACSASLDDIGSATFMSDIAAMAHEIQETRLFRS